MSRFAKAKSGKESWFWLQRLVKLWLASGMLVMPWTGYATEIVRTDGATGDTHSGNIHNIYAGKQISDTVGASTFSKFSVTQGDVANMQFRTASGSNNYSTLLNFVDSRIDINGTVNAIRNGGVGGHLYFLSPNGMAVGANGAINAGSLTVLTPTQNWWDNVAKVGSIASQGLSSSVLSEIQAAAMPINASGTIAVQGKLTTSDRMRLKAGTINIGADVNGANYTAAVLKSGAVDFSDVVNLSAEQCIAAGITDLTAVDTGTGDIIIAAQATYNDNSGITSDKKVSAKVLVAGGSQVTAAGAADITATATNTVNVVAYTAKVLKDGEVVEVPYYVVNGVVMTEAEYKAAYRQEADKYLPGSTVSTYANVEIIGNNTSVKGDSVNIAATARNIYSTQDCGIVPAGFLANVVVGVLLNGFDAAYAVKENVAEVKIGEGVTLTATGADTITPAVKSALTVSADAQMEVTLGTDVFSVGILLEKYPAANIFPAVGFN